MNSVLCRLSVLLAAALAAGGAIAGSNTNVSERAMAREAEAIIVGSVVDTRSSWLGKTLVTVAKVKVDETLKGARTPLVEVVLPGGIDATRRVPVAMTYPGAPRLVPDEHVLLFLDRSDIGKDALIVSGYAQGKYMVARDPSGQTIVTRNASEARNVGAPGLREGGTERRTLDEFRRQLKGYLAPPRP